jgi:hypothetical protein
MSVSINIGKPAFEVYFVLHKDDDGEDYDGFVIASNPTEAIKLWRQAFHDDDDENDPHSPDQIRKIPWAKPQFGPARVIEWSELPMVQ